MVSAPGDRHPVCSHELVLVQVQACQGGNVSDGDLEGAERAERGTSSMAPGREASSQGRGLVVVLLGEDLVGDHVDPVGGGQPVIVLDGGNVSAVDFSLAGTLLLLFPDGDPVVCVLAAYFLEVMLQFLLRFATALPDSAYLLRRRRCMGMLMAPIFGRSALVFGTHSGIVPLLLLSGKSRRQPPYRVHGSTFGPSWLSREPFQQEEWTTSRQRKGVRIRGWRHHCRLGNRDPPKECGRILSQAELGP